MEADLVVLDLKSTPIIAYRMNYTDSLEGALFVQMTMADIVRSALCVSRRVYQRPSCITQLESPSRKECFAASR